MYRRSWAWPFLIGNRERAIKNHKNISKFSPPQTKATIRRGSHIPGGNLDQHAGWTRKKPNFDRLTKKVWRTCTELPRKGTSVYEENHQNLALWGILSDHVLSNEANEALYISNAFLKEWYLVISKGEQSSFSSFIPKTNTGWPRPATRSSC